MTEAVTLCACACGQSALRGDMIEISLARGNTCRVIRQHMMKFIRERGEQSERTGRQIVEAAGLKCIVGPHNRFYWKTRTVTLQDRVANGTDPASVVISHHEIAHSKQPRWWWPLRIFAPMRWFMECDCWSLVFGTDV